MLLYMLLAHLAVFLAAHIYYLTESSLSVYIHLYAAKVLEFIFPVCSAFIAAVCYAKHGVRASLLSSLTLSLSSLVYSIPFFYEYYVLEAGYRSSDAILVSAVRSLAGVAAQFLHISALALISILVSLIIKRKRGVVLSLRDFILSASADASSLDFSSPTVQISLTICISELIRSLTFEIIDTVDFLKDAIFDLQLGELATIVINYILLIALALISHFLILCKLRIKPEE